VCTVPHLERRGGGPQRRGGLRLHPHVGPGVLPGVSFNSRNEGLNVTDVDDVTGIVYLVGPGKPFLAGDRVSFDSRNEGL